MGAAPKHRHAAPMHNFTDAKTVNHHAGFDQV
jgi:hypothetical protein